MGESRESVVERCERCGRFIGEDCAEGVDWSKGMRQDGDVAWTGRFYCGSGVGCNRDPNAEPLLAALTTEQKLEEKSG